MSPKSKKAKIVAEPSRERERSQSAVRGTYTDPKENASAAPARRRSSRIAARRTQGHQAQTLQPTARLGNRTKPTKKTKEAATRAKLATIQGKSSIQPPKARVGLSSGEPVTAPDIDFGKRVRGRPKKVAGHIEQSLQDPASGSQRHPVDPSICRATKPGARQNVTRGKSSETQFITAAIDPIPFDSLPSSFSSQSSDSHLVEQEQSKLQGPTTALSRAALEEHTRNTTPVALVDKIRTIKRISKLWFAEKSVDAQSSGTVVVDQQEVFNYKWGYLPPLGEEPECLLISIIEDPTLARIMVRIGPENGNFRSGLEDNRNVNLKPSVEPDPLSAEINALNLEDFFPEKMDQQRCYDELWHFDKVKCMGNSNEALLQRTLMISLIARHTLVYQQDTGKTQMLDFNVEEPWQYPPMPTKAVWRVREERASDLNFLTQPKPDLSICFNRESVIPGHIWKILPVPTRALACFENMNSGASRIFHFLTVEAIKAMININADKAKYQSLNNASQALHNMYEFFSDAGLDHKKIFFTKVRFFSAVANREGMLVRIHRAVEIPEDANPGSLIMPDQPKYRLKFEYEEFARIDRENEYSRKRVSDIFKRILKYAAEDLGELIKAAALALATKMNDDPAAYDARRDEAFYRYEQPSPVPTKANLDGTLRLSSRGGLLTDVKRHLLRATLNMNRAKKRNSNDRDAGFTNDENPQRASKRAKWARGRNPKQSRKN